MQESEQNSEFSLLLCHSDKNIKSQSSVANGVDFIICSKKSTVLKGKKKMCRINQLDNKYLTLLTTNA